MMFAQNPWPDRLVGQYYEDVDRFLPLSAYSLLDDRTQLFNNDRAIASIAMNSFLFPVQGGNAPVGSSILGYWNKSSTLNHSRKIESLQYRKGIPEAMNMGYLIPYLNEDIYEGVYSELVELEKSNSPYFAYFHLYSLIIRIGLAMNILTYFAMMITPRLRNQPIRFQQNFNKIF